MARTRILAVVGPTACGKTGRGVALAKALDGEIVSADSRQIYRGMDIGTGKDLAEYDGVPAHMLDIVPAGYRYNLFEYIRDASRAIDDIFTRGRLPVVVGGTGMYVEHLLRGISLPEVPPDTPLRQSLATKSLEELSAMLAAMKRLHNTTDTDTPARAIRAIEIETFYASHPDVAETARNARPRPATVIGIDIPRELRRQRITARLRHRLDREDMVGEVRSLLDSGIAPESLIYYGLEYKYLTLYVTGRMSREAMESELETAIHQFAKRQMTWFRGMERRGIPIHWLPWDMPADEFVDMAAQLYEEGS